MIEGLILSHPPAIPELRYGILRHPPLTQCTARFILGENEEPSDENMVPGSLENGTYQ